MDAIIFDIDGTLWDSRIPVAHSWNHSIEKYTGKQSRFTAEFLGGYFGRTMDVIVELLLPDMSEAEREYYGNLIFQEENEWLEHEPGILYPGVAATMQNLAEQWPLYVVSNCQRGYIDTMLRVTDLEKFISGTICYGDYNEGKGKNLIRLCRQYDIKEPVYVGDTQGDAEACAEAHIPMIYAAYGLGVVEHPWKQINHFSELLSVL